MMLIKSRHASMSHISYFSSASEGHADPQTKHSRFQGERFGVPSSHCKKETLGPWRASNRGCANAHHFETDQPRIRGEACEQTGSGIFADLWGSATSSASHPKEQADPMTEANQRIPIASGILGMFGTRGWIPFMAPHNWRVPGLFGAMMEAGAMGVGGGSAPSLRTSPLERCKTVQGYSKWLSIYVCK